MQGSCCQMQRRGFLKAVLAFFALMWGGLTTFPLLRYLSSSTGESTAESQVTSLSVGKVDDFAPGSSRNFRFGNIPALLIRNESGNFFVYNAICTHLGCTVQFSEKKKNIFCACHGGQYDPETGKNIAGPPPKPLAVLKVAVENDEVIVSKA